MLRDVASPVSVEEFVILLPKYLRCKNVYLLNIKKKKIVSFHFLVFSMYIVTYAFP